MSQSDYYRLHSALPLSADHPFYAGKGSAPDQYRIGIKYPAQWVAEKFHMQKYYAVFTVVDFCCAVVSCWLLYLLLCGSSFFIGLSGTRQLLAATLLLGFLTYPLVWAVPAPWMRPETLPSALYLAILLLLLSRLRNRRLLLGAVFILTLWQSFSRTDIPAFWGLAILLVSFTSCKELLGSRAFGVLCGLSMISIAVAVQLYLQFRLFPHVTYSPDTPVVQLLFNLDARRLITFSVAMSPYALFLVLAAKYRDRLEPIDLLSILASLLYLPLWLTVGVVIEVRIFVPFLLVLAPQPSN